MKTLVLGASGATGKLVVSQFVKKDVTVKALLRSTASFPRELSESGNVETVTGNIDDLTPGQIAELIADCDSVVSCLGHNVTFQGLFGKPRKLVCHALEQVVEAMRGTGKPYKLVLMSTTAYTNGTAGERNTFGEAAVLALFKALLPPHADNVAAGDFLVKRVSSQARIEWVAVRPDGLIDEAEPCPVVVTDAKRRSPVFDPGKTSRINVARFMGELLTDDTVWKKWVYKTPVIYNQEWS